MVLSLSGVVLYVSLDILEKSKSVKQKLFFETEDKFKSEVIVF